MKFAYNLLPLLLFLFASSLFAEVRVKISGLHSSEGFVMVGLYKEEGYPEQEKVFQGKRVKAAPGIELLFDDIPDGVYAISAYHDEDSNGILNKTFFGVPTEGYGFSKNVKGSMGPPSFRDVSFLYSGKDISFEIQINY